MIIYVQMFKSNRKPTLLSVLAAAATAATGAVLLASPAQASGLALSRPDVVPGIVQEVAGDFQVAPLEDDWSLGGVARTLLSSCATALSVSASPSTNTCDFVFLFRGGDVTFVPDVLHCFVLANIRSKAYLPSI